MIADSGSGINFDWEVVCSYLRPIWLILEIVFIVHIFGDSHCEELLFWEIFRRVFFFHCEDLFNCSSLGHKNCFSLLVLRLKIFVLIIWLTVIGSGSDFKMDANLDSEFGILIDSGSDLKFEMICQLWLFIWVGFFHNWVDFVVS